MGEDWAGFNTRQVQEVLVALLGGALGWIVTWVLISDD